MKGILKLSNLIFFYVFLLFLLIGCNSPTEFELNSSSGANNQETENEEEGVTTLRLGWPTDGGFPTPFAFSSTGPAGFLRVSYLYDSLTWKDQNGIIPWLAKNWEVSDDGLSYKVHLREGVTWHDEKPLTSADVKFTFDYFALHHFLWGDISMVNNVEVIDETTVVFHLNEPFSPFAEEVMGIIPIIPEHVWGSVEDPKSFREEGSVIGSGPYILASHHQESGQYLFKANTNHFRGEPVIDEISYITVGNRALALKNKDIDAIWTNNFNDMQELKKAGFQVMESDPHGSIVRVVFNMEDQLLGQKEMRQAIAYALDRATIAEKVLGGNVVVGNPGVIPPGSPWYNAHTKQYDFNVEKANEMLDELGFTERNQDGVRIKSEGQELAFTIMISSDERDAHLMKEMLKQVGVQVNIQKVDIATFTAAMSEGNYDMAITSHVGVSGDPDFLRRWFTSTDYNAKASHGSILQNEEFKRLAEKQLILSDVDQRKQVVGQMQEVIAEEIPTLAIYHRPFYWMYDESTFNGWFNTWGGIANGITSWENKAAFLPDDK